eukprot:645677-Rhodomonas_salina.1
MTRRRGGGGTEAAHPAERARPYKRMSGCGTEGAHPSRRTSGCGQRWSKSSASSTSLATRSLLYTSDPKP